MAKETKKQSLFRNKVQAEGAKSKDKYKKETDFLSEWVIPQTKEDAILDAALTLTPFGAIGKAGKKLYKKGKKSLFKGDK